MTSGPTRGVIGPEYPEANKVTRINLSSQWIYCGLLQPSVRHWQGHMYMIMSGVYVVNQIERQFER